MTRIEVQVPAMTCRSAARVVSAAVRDVPGVRLVAVDVTTATLRVQGAASPELVRAALQDAGYESEDLRVWASGAE